MEIVWPTEVKPNKEIDIDIAPNNDHIIVLRRKEGHCSYELSHVPHHRKYSEEEIINFAKKNPKHNLGINTAYF